jgi:hypothetical protein
MFFFLLFIEGMYFGFFLLPLTTSLIPRIPLLLRGLTREKIRVLLLLTGGLALVLGFTLQANLRMPYAPLYINRAGLGPNDLIVGRPPLVGRDDLIGFTILCALSLWILVTLLLNRRLQNNSPVSRLVLYLFIGQILGCFVLSAGLSARVVDGHWAPTFDRYLLPFLPFLILAVIKLAEPFRFNQVIAWSLTGLMALFSIIGTRDSLVFHEKTWELAQAANRLGIDNTRLDGGATWDAYHLAEFPLPPPGKTNTPVYEIHSKNPDAVRTRTPPYWVYAWASTTDSTYVIAGEHLDGFEKILDIDFDSWVLQKKVILYLLKRPP